MTWHENADKTHIIYMIAGEKHPQKLRPPALTAPHGDTLTGEPWYRASSVDRAAFAASFDRMPDSSDSLICFMFWR